MLLHHQREPHSADECIDTRHHLRVVGRGQNGQPRTYRLAPSSTQQTAYRRLALTILGLDVATLASELRRARRPEAQSA